MEVVGVTALILWEWCGGGLGPCSVTVSPPQRGYPDMQGEGEEAGGVGRPVRQGCVPTGGLAGDERAVLLGSSGGWCPWAPCLGGLAEPVHADEEVSFQGWSRGCARDSLGAGANVWRLRKDWREQCYTADVQGPGHPTPRSPAALRPGESGVPLRVRCPHCSDENGSGSAFF